MSDSGAPLAFLELFVVVAFGLVYLVVDRIAKRAARRYGRPEPDRAPDDAREP